MKRIFFLLITSVAFAACGGGNDNKTASTETPKTADITKDPAYQKGLELASKSDCFTCHNVDDKVTGPSYREVANKYAGMPDTIVTHLAKKVISGGSGVWGEIQMTPHPGLSQADAEAIVRYVLLLKK
ncbi:MAG TPA: c-type cytochrome [Chitinophagaceae bacterium]|jgi:cytochrome c